MKQNQIGDLSLIVALVLCDNLVDAANANKGTERGDELLKEAQELARWAIAKSKGEETHETSID